MRKNIFLATIFTLLLLFLVLTACGGAMPSQVTQAPLPTVTPTNSDSATPTVQPTNTAEPTSTQTLEPSATATEEATVTPQPTETPESVAPLRVVYVANDDVLNVRSAPGADADVVGILEPGSSSVTITGSGQMVGDSLWVPVEGDQGLTGWVNGLFLTEEVETTTFCQEEEPKQLLDKLRAAIESQDTEQLKQLTADGRGLRVRTYWWNPEVRLTENELETAFAGGESYDWGVEDGSGFAITGSFADVIMPLLEQDLLGATEIACNEILHGSTTGLIQLPEEYEGINFYSLYRPAPPDEIEFDWGTWVVGMERWQGNYYVSFLIHYQYEI